MDLFVGYASPDEGDHRKPVSVPRPSVHAGIGSALRNCYVPAPLPEEFLRLLAKLR